MEHISHAVYQQSVATALENWRLDTQHPPKAELVEAALCLMRLDLDPLRDQLTSLYSPSPRGRPPWNPLCVLRAFLLMTLLRQTSLTKFAQDLRGEARWAVLAGFAPGETPSVGVFYAFVDRLEDGPFQTKCPHRILPAEIRKETHLRNLKEEKAQKEARRQAILAQCDSITGQLKEELLARQAQPRPQDYAARLEDILIKTAVEPSAARGLLGDQQAVVVSGDGAALVSGANPDGHATCECRKNGVYNCACARRYSDPTADWGYDSYREVYYFGHTYYQHVVSTSGHDLPVHLAVGPASESDFTLSLKSFDRFQKACRENGVLLQVFAGVYDAGHDSYGIYEYFQSKEVTPVIALNPRGSSQPAPSGTAERVNSAGLPLCPAGLPMRRHGTAAHGRIGFNCPVKRPTHEAGKTVWKAHVVECPHGTLCQPETKMGPTVYVKSASDVRFYPPLPRGSAEFVRLYNLRSGCERSNAMKKVVHQLERRVCRSETHYFFRLTLVSIVEHAKAWLAEDRKKWGEDSLVLSEMARLKAAAPASG